MQKSLDSDNRAHLTDFDYFVLLKLCISLPHSFIWKIEIDPAEFLTGTTIGIIRVLWFQLPGSYGQNGPMPVQSGQSGKLTMLQSSAVMLDSELTC